MSNLLESNPCPKCSHLMRRKYRPKDQPKKSYGFSEWDVCENCNHIQHYEQYKFKIETRKQRREKNRKKKVKIPKMSYRDYLKSSYWKKRKNMYYSDHGGKHCEICGKKAGVTLHHKRYDVKFGAEPNDALVMLCRLHHHEFHQNHELKTNMVKDTDLYVETAKQLFNSNIDDLSWIK